MESSWKRKIAASAIVVIVVTLVLRVFIVEGFVVKGDSMSPAIESGDYVFVYKLAYTWSEPKRGDIIVAAPRDKDIKVLKRIIGLPGERFEIADGIITTRQARLDPKVPLEELYLPASSSPIETGTFIKLDPQEYFALGDNRNKSVDSRELGPIDKWDIKGKVFGVFNFSRLEYKSI